MKPRWLLFLVLGCLLHHAAAEGEFKPSEAKMKEKLQAVVDAQLSAFRQNDYAAAYEFAHAEIKAQYPAEAFERMVRLGYPAIVKSVSSHFGLSFDNGDDAVVNVTVVGRDGRSDGFQYLLKRDGAMWRIAGVVAAEKKSLEV